MGREIFCETVLFSSFLLQTYVTNEIVLFLNIFFSGKADTNAIKTCALHISEQLKTCDLGGVGKQRYVVVVVFFVVLLVVTLHYLVHVRTRGRTTPEMVSPSVLYRKVFSLFLR